MLFTAVEARAAGITRGVLRGMRYRRVLGSIYVDGTVAVTPRLQAEAALLLAPGTVVARISQDLHARHHPLLAA